MAGVPFDRDKPRPDYLGNLLPGDEWKNAPLSERVLHVARSQERKKVRELSPNWGGMVTAYLKVAGLFGPAPWCAAFVYWCLVESGADRSKLWKGPASTWSLAVWAKATGRLSVGARRGDVFVWNTGTPQRYGTGHTGVVTKAEGSNLKTIEGNTNDKGSREGVAVLDKDRTTFHVKQLSRGGLWGFVKLD